MISVNSVPNDPSLSDLLDLLKKEIFLGLNCHHVGTVQSFNAAAQTVVCTVNYTKTLFEFNSASNTYVPVQINYPTLIDCPLIILGGGTANLTFPVKKGDECLLLFNDRDMDNWFQTGQFGPVATGRLHSFTDAFALVGVNSTPNLIETYDAVRALLTNGNVSVGINPTTNKVTIQNTAAGTLNTVLQNILTQMQAIGNAVSIPGVPVNAAAATLLATYATTLGSLLE